MVVIWVKLPLGEAAARARGYDVGGKLDFVGPAL
jgi:hypothetical protein